MTGGKRTGSGWCDRQEIGEGQGRAGPVGGNKRGKVGVELDKSFGKDSTLGRAYVRELGLLQGNYVEGEGRK